MSPETLSQVTYLIGKAIEEGCHELLTAEYISTVLHIPLSDAEVALSL